MHDIRHTFRSWRRTPVLAVTAIVTVSLGVAANAAVFSVAHAVLFRPLPYPAPDRLVELFEESPAVDQPDQTFRVSPLNYLTWSMRAKSFDAIAAFQGTAFIVSDDAGAERIGGNLVTASLFRVLGVAPIAGRELRGDDEAPGSPPVALIARSLWERRYGGDPGAVGRTITLDGERHAIVGVVPDTFHEVGRSQLGTVSHPQVFVPLRIDPARERRGNHVLRAAARLHAGVSLEQARAEMIGIASAMGQEFPATNDGWRVRLVPIQESMLDEGIRPSLLALLGAVVAVMLIACANVSNLVLAKATGRRRELALRSALGASRRRLVRQMLTESICLAAISGVIGIWVTLATADALRSLLPATLPRLEEVRIDLVVFAFGLAVSLGSGMLFGMLPAIRASRVDPLAALTQGGRGVHGSSRPLLRHGLVVAQVALATMLLVGGALLLQSFLQLQRVPLGFDPSGVLAARIGLPRPAYADSTRISLFHQRLMHLLEGDPGVESAAVATSAPFAPGVRRGLFVRRWPLASGGATQSVAEHIVSSGYFRTLAIPIVAGRTFDDRDRAGAPAAVIVSDATARRLWPGINPVGQQLERDGQPHDVVGVAGDIRGASDRGARGGGVESEPRAAIYLPAAQLPQRTATVLLRPASDSRTLVDRLRAAVRSIDPAVPIDEPRALDGWLGETIARPRLTTTIAGAFAVIGVLLAAVGVYGVAAHTVGQRTPEIGLRMALGATKRQVIAMVLRGGLTSAAAGAAVGLSGALLVNRALRALLFEVQPNDPFTFASAALLVAAVSLLACYLPGRRAARVDPLAALRGE